MEKEKRKIDPANTAGKKKTVKWKRPCQLYLWLKLPICTAIKHSPFIASSLTFTLFVEGGVAATDAAIIIVASASLVNTAF